jgi:predicted HTH domain antitoxin
MRVTFTVADDIPFSLKESAEEFTRDIRFLSALMWYRKNKLSLGKAAELAGYEKLEFIERMKMEGEAIFAYDADAMTEIFADVARLP